MLVLDRRVQEGFWIEGRIFVKVLSIGRHRVKIGVEAPQEFKIEREELRSRPTAEAVERDHSAPRERASAPRERA